MQARHHCFLRYLLAAGLIGKQMIETFAKVRLEGNTLRSFVTENGDRCPRCGNSHFLYRGDSADTLAAISLAKERGRFFFRYVKRGRFLHCRITDTGTYIHVGPKAVCGFTKVLWDSHGAYHDGLSLGKEKQTVSTANTKNRSGS
jgi:glucosamine--fructose-6-phosphate aminotransferase (isomerizing)